MPKPFRRKRSAGKRLPGKRYDVGEEANKLREQQDLYTKITDVLAREVRNYPLLENQLESWLQTIGQTIDSATDSPIKRIRTKAIVKTFLLEALFGYTRNSLLSHYSSNITLTKALSDAKKFFTQNPQLLQQMKKYSELAKQLDRLKRELEITGKQKLDVFRRKPKRLFRAKTM